MEYYNISWNYTDYYFDGDYFHIGSTSFSTIYSSIKIFSIACNSITILLGLAGNGLVIWISGFKMKTISAVWFLNLAIADFITSVFLIFRIMQMFLAFPSKYYSNLCNISITSLFTNMVTSVHFLILISLDRCVSVMWPFWSKIHRTKKLAWTLSAVMWTVNIIFFCFQFAIVDLDFLTFSECSLIYDTPYRIIRYKASENVMLIMLNICLFTVPFLTIFISYGFILLKLRTLRRRRSARPFVTIAAILTSFFVCWFPYQTWSLVSLRYNEWRIDLIINEIATILAYFNCAINPILYVLLSRGFKNNFVKSIPQKVEIILSDPDDFDDRNDENNVNQRTNALDTEV
ncbi:hypothetical protein GDO81_023205 [Engystomops pustulosus]|uniref:G-protein coupled receptors family 1 profile domain-containing protein n=1 Tax=Engystomops pustulosus TaxID=76066 RepID=A0AAV6Z9I6_ENGPU|nr:hypothetical protein GDO81_023205 [Engystomops pustulosus]